MPAPAFRDTADSDRKALLAKVHIARKDLCLTDAEYRAALENLFGVASAADLDVPRLRDLVDHFQGKGWRPKRKAQSAEKPEKPSSRFVVIPDSDPNARQKRYILALARKLGWSLDYLNKRCAIQFGVDKFIWLKDQDHLQILGKDMALRCRKRGWPADSRYFI